MVFLIIVFFVMTLKYLTHTSISVDCPASMAMMIAHCSVDLTAHVTKSKGHALF